MRPVLVAIPSKLLLAVALVLAVGIAVRDVLRRRADPKAPWSTTPLYLIVGAAILSAVKTGSIIPSVAALSQPWTPVPIYSYGVMLGSSLIVGWFLTMRLARQDGVATESAASIYMWTAVWSIVGARILYVIANYSDFDGVMEVLMINRGGLVAYGGMIGGFLASWYGCRKRGIPLLRWGDVAAPAVVLGTGITRIGCFLFGCDYGRRTDLPWGLSFPVDSPAFKHHVGAYGLARDAAHSFAVHPTQLYEMVVGFLLFGVLMLIRRWRTFSGQVFLGWIIGYGTLRPLIEILRDDTQRGSVGPLSTSQFIGIMAVVLGMALLIYLVKRHGQDPAGMRLWEQPAVGIAPEAPAARDGESPGRGRKTGARRKKR